MKNSACVHFKNIECPKIAGGKNRTHLPRGGPAGINSSPFNAKIGSCIRNVQDHSSLSLRDKGSLRERECFGRAVQVFDYSMREKRLR